MGNTIFDKKNISSVEDLQKNWNDPYIQWWAAGMPSFNQTKKSAFKQIILKFKTKEHRKKFGEQFGYKLTDKTNNVYYPPKSNEKNNKNRYLETDV